MIDISAGAPRWIGQRHLWFNRLPRRRPSPCHSPLNPPLVQTSQTPPHHRPHLPLLPSLSRPHLPLLPSLSPPSATRPLSWFSSNSSPLWQSPPSLPIKFFFHHPPPPPPPPAPDHHPVPPCLPWFTPAPLPPKVYP